MVDDRQIAQSKAIQRQTGRTFHVATRFLPERVRYPTYVLYAFFRVADEIVDDADGVPPEEQAAELESLRAQALGEKEPEGPVLSAFRELAVEHDISESEIDTFVDAMKSDIDTDRYETYEDLEAYMRGSASAVGVMMTEVMDPERRETALPHAVALGEAFQMTNFLRDVREDVVDRDRVYLPESTLREHGVDPDQIRRLEFSPGVGDAVRAELRRTERLYREGVAGIKYLPDDCQFPVLLAAVLYADHHRLIRGCEYDVVNTEPSLSTARKLWLAARTRWHWQWNRDPEAVFRRASAVSFPDPPRSGRGAVDTAVTPD
ncbi:phytoene synthase [Natronoarchaeum philippinense]|uniref:Phytoene synthase n=1 Tax=Natronoarchaeum philippinense TaxID=558529 RepID=A0A285PE00_NATPI|nr:phytoene/squalene synthase family protein [Natronoarchaeum philippinense]SNZ18091.1 phytoene synthase [Natronoarchaeum philippinense]